MGEAKRRGSFEERQASAIERNEIELDRERINLAQRREMQRQYDLDHPEEAARRAQARRTLHTMLAVSAGISRRKF